MGGSRPSRNSRYSWLGVDRGRFDVGIDVGSGGRPVKGDARLGVDVLVDEHLHVVELVGEAGAELDDRTTTPSSPLVATGAVMTSARSIHATQWHSPSHVTMATPSDKADSLGSAARTTAHHRHVGGVKMVVIGGYCSRR